MVISLSFIILFLNFASIKFFNLSIIFILMRIMSAYISRNSKIDIWKLISYIFFLPELITGPHRDYSDWVIPKINFKEIFSINNILFLLVYLDLILVSGYIYKIIYAQVNFLVFEVILTSLTLFIQFWSASKIVNLISIIFSQKPILNFNNPWVATSFSEFWTRWHISLGKFARKYVNQPTNFLLSKNGLNRFISYSLSIFLSFLFITLWHKVSLKLLIIGIFSSIVIISEKTIFENIIKNIKNSLIGRFILILYTQSIFFIFIYFQFNEIKNILIYPR